MRQTRRLVAHSRAVLLAVSIALALVVREPAMGQQPSDIASANVTAARIDGEEVTLALQLLDRAGNPASAPPGGLITATIEGRPATVASVTEGVDVALPLALVLVIDTSGSMAGAPLAAAKLAIRPLIESLQAGDRAAIVEFSQTVSMPVPLTGDKAALLAGLNALVAGGNTSLYAGVVEAAKVVASAPEPRKAIVLLSDGEDFGNVSGVSQAQAVAAAQSSGVPHFVVGLGSELNTTFLETISATGGGSFLTSATSTQLGSLYASVSERLRRQYTVGLRLPAGLPSGTRRGVLTAGTATAQFEFSYVAAVSAPAAAIEGPSGTIRESSDFRVVNVPPGLAVSVTLDGTRVASQPGERAVTIDPFLLDPQVEHTLAAEWTTASGAQRVDRRFRVEALPPRLAASSTSLVPSPGGRFSVAVESQPGPLAVRFLVDGREVSRDASPPYEFQLPPRDEFNAGPHLVAAVIEGPGGATSTHEFPFKVENSSRSPIAGWMIVSLSALAVMAAAAYGAQLGLVRYRNRERTMNPDEFAARVAERLPVPEERAPVEEAAPESAASVPGVWGVLQVVDGPGKGTQFELRAERELVGRGKFCSVRLPDKAAAEAHFVLSPEGELVASLPHLRVEVNGEALRTVRLANGQLVKLGRTTLRYIARG